MARRFLGSPSGFSFLGDFLVVLVSFTGLADTSCSSWAIRFSSSSTRLDTISRVIDICFSIVGRSVGFDTIEPLIKSHFNFFYTIHKPERIERLSNLDSLYIEFFISIFYIIDVCILYRIFDNLSKIF